MVVWSVGFNAGDSYDDTLAFEEGLVPILKKFCLFVAYSLQKPDFYEIGWSDYLLQVQDE